MTEPGPISPDLQAPAPPTDHPPGGPNSPLISWRNLRRLGPAGLMGVFSLAVPPIGAVILLSQLDFFAEPLRTHHWGPVAAAIGFGLLGGMALLPTAALAIFAGWAFRFGTGFSVAVAGFTLAGALGFAIARRFAGATVVDLIDHHPRWRAVHRALLHSGALRTFLIICLLRIPSAPPFAMTTVAMAALHVRVWPFLLGTFLGVMPRTAAYVLLASQAEKLDYGVASGWQMLAVWGGATVVVIVLITLVARQALAIVTANEEDAAPCEQT